MTASSTQTVHGSAESGAAGGFARAWDELVLAIRRQGVRPQAGASGLSLSQYYLLRPLADGDPVATCQLAESAGIAAPTATRVFDGLVRAGLVERGRHERDRRCVTVALTSLGRRRLNAKRRQLERRRRLLYERLEPGERKLAERLLGHLSELLAEL